MGTPTSRLIDSGTDQGILERALNNNTTRETFEAGIKLVRSRARDQILHTMRQHEVDVILGPSDGGLACVAACAGYPIASVPLGFADFNGRAFGMNVLASAGEEKTIFRLMSAWENTFPNARVAPPLLVNWTSENPPISQL